jgi:uncharacterized short protein YbdD (DUF466 family)
MIIRGGNISAVQSEDVLRREMKDLGISIMFSDAYDNAFIAEEKYRLRGAVDEILKQPDWTDFKEYLKNKVNDMDKLTPYILKREYNCFQVDKGLSLLAEKVAGNYQKYVSDLRTKNPDDIIRSAYEIYNKGCIVDYCNSSITSLSPDNLQVLLDTDNVLDEIYQEWDKMTQLHGVAEIDTAIEDTAYRLRMAQAVKQMMEQKQKQELSESKVIADKPGIPKLAKRTRR